MISEILTAAGVRHKRSRFPAPPAETYAVWFDDIDADGPDPVPSLNAAGVRSIVQHSATVELYEPRPDDAAELAIEAELRDRGLSYHKDDREWLQDVQRYQTIYSFEFYTKS